VEQLEMARRARHEQVDDALRLRCEVRLLRGERIVDRAGVALATEKVRERHAAKTDTALLQKPATGHVEWMRTEHESGHSFVLVSSRFSSTRARATHAADSGAGTPLGSILPSPSRSAGFAPGASNRLRCFVNRFVSSAISSTVGLRETQRRR